MTAITPGNNGAWAPAGTPATSDATRDLTTSTLDKQSQTRGFGSLNLRVDLRAVEQMCGKGAEGVSDTVTPTGNKGDAGSESKNNDRQGFPSRRVGGGTR